VYVGYVVKLSCIPLLTPTVQSQQLSNKYDKLNVQHVKRIRVSMSEYTNRNEGVDTFAGIHRSA